MRLLLCLTCLFCVPAWAQDSAECVVSPHALAHIHECDYYPGNVAGGCSGRLAQLDASQGGDNWYSETHPQSGPMLGQYDWCDVPTARSFRGVYRVHIQQSGQIWIVAKQSISDPTHTRFFIPAEPDSVPPSPKASDYMITGWKCDKSEPFTPYNGAYAYAFHWGALTTQEMNAVSGEQLAYLPGYMDAYNSVADGLRDIMGSPHNPHRPDSYDSNVWGWNARSTIAELMADGPIGNRHARDEMWFTYRKVAEYVRLYFIEHDAEALAALGWPVTPTGDFWVALNDVIDNWYQHTIGPCFQCDPLLMFQDWDVADDPSSWGMIKKIYEEVN